jgi:hypothetical protein
LQCVKRAEDQAAHDERDKGDANEPPEVKEPLMKQSAKAGWGVGLVDEEGSGDQEEVDEEEERDGGVAEAHAGIACGAFVEVEVGFAEGAEVEGGGEALRSEGVVEKGGDPTGEGYGEEEGEAEVEGVGPEERGEAAEGDGEAVEEDVAAFVHLVLGCKGGSERKADPLRG